MVTTRRALAVLERNVKATRFGPSYWVLVLAGLFEPLFYLLTIGVGLGALIDARLAYHGRDVTYTEFVAPGTLAASAVAGVLGMSIYGFHHKLRYSRLFEVMLFTPLRSPEIAIGELVWSIVRGGLFSTLFIVVMTAFGLVDPARMTPALAAVLLVCAAFATAGMAVTTYVRGWQDFDLIMTGQTGMLLFSGTFFPISLYPAPVGAAVQALPLYQAIELVRGAALGSAGFALAGHAAYLLVMFTVGLVVTCRRMDRHLRT